MATSSLPSIPAPLKRAIKSASEGMRSDERATPRPFDRRAIYALLGPLGEPSGRQRRVALDAAAAKYVSPVWDRFWWDDAPDDWSVPAPRTILAAAERAVRNEPFPEALYEESREVFGFWFAVRMEGFDPVAKERALCAGFAAVCALRTALGDDPFMKLTMGHDTPEQDIGEDEADAARWAAQAVSADIGRWDISACRSFWEWWLSEAVPSAWCATASDGSI